MLELEWRTSSDLAALHAAWCATQLPDRCVKLPSEFTDAALALSGLQPSLGVTVDRFWDLLFTLSVDNAQNRDLAQRMAIRCLPESARSAELLSRLASAIAVVESQFQRAFPNLQRDLLLRERPLREQWDSYGTGLLIGIGGLTDRELIVDQADVLLVQPVVSGAGWAHLASNRVHIEAMLTNEDPALTEAMRLAWLLSQLKFDVPVYSEAINTFRLRQVAALAMLPATLIAAEELGYGAYSDVSLQHALSRWCCVVDPQLASVQAKIVAVWWQTVEQTRPTWPVALTGLDRMLET